MRKKIEKPKGQDKHCHNPNHQECSYGPLFFFIHRRFPLVGESKKVVRVHMSLGKNVPGQIADVQNDV
jgi:hypothetical protein